MEIRLLIYTTLLSLALSNASAQTSLNRPYSDQDEISDVMHNYYEAWKAGDAEKIEKTLHHSFRLKYMHEGDVQIMDKLMYLSGFVPPIVTNQSHMHLVFINVNEDTAMARMDIKSSKRYATHYINLIKSENKWVIIDQLTKHEWK